MLCEYIPKEAIDRKGNLYSGALWVYCDQKLETHSVFFSQVLLPEKPAWLAWLGSDTAWFSLFSHDSIQTSPDESNLKLDVILASLSINMILRYLPISVMWECVCDVSLLWWLPHPGWFQDVAPGGCQILDGSKMPPATGQVTLVVAAVSVTGINESSLQTLISK
jgi:hypothetical protein